MRRAESVLLRALALTLFGKRKARLHFTAVAHHRGRAQHALGRTADTHERVDAGLWVERGDRD